MTLGGMGMGGLQARKWEVLALQIPPGEEAKLGPGGWLLLTTQSQGPLVQAGGGGRAATRSVLLQGKSARLTACQSLLQFFR